MSPSIIRNKLNLLYQIFFVTKWVFNKPKKKKILIYDDESIEELNFFLKNKSFEIFHIRYEQINIYVLLFCIFKNGLRNIKANYKLNYFNFVKPKVVITLIDENPGFFKLKNIYDQAKYVSVQFHFKDNIFYDYINKFKKKNKNYKFKCDHSFVLGENDAVKYRNFIDSEITNLGSIKNNNNIIKKNFKGEVKKIIFISQLSSRLSKDVKNSRGYKIFQYLKNYCKENKIKLYLLSKHGADFEKKHREVYKGKDWVYLPKKNTINTYKIINNAQFLVFDNTTLGYEALSKNIKGVCFPIVFPYKKYSKKFTKEGPFWSTKISEKILSKKINFVKQLDNNRWKKYVKKTVKEIIVYNPNNTLFKQRLKKYINHEIL